MAFVGSSLFLCAVALAASFLPGRCALRDWPMRVAIFLCGDSSAATYGASWE